MPDRPPHPPRPQGALEQSNALAHDDGDGVDNANPPELQGRRDRVQLDGVDVAATVREAGEAPDPKPSESQSGSAALDAETLKDLEIARGLADAGIPILVLKPYRDREGSWDAERKPGYQYPEGWSNSEADPSTIDQWEPGDALVMLTGRGVDVVDVDPRNGGEDSAQELREQDAYPQSVGHQVTPSGGYHHFVAPLNVPTANGLLPGIDVLTRGGSAFIPPTQRVSKVTSAVERYRWTEAPNLERLDPESGQPLAQMVRDRVRGKTKAPGPQLLLPHPYYDDLDASEQARVDAYLRGVVQGTSEEFDAVSKWPEGYRDPDRPGVGWQKTVADACLRFGSLARASWTPWSLREAKEHLESTIHPDVLADVVLETEWAAQSGRGDPASYPLGGDPPEDRGPDDVRNSSWRPVDLSDVLAGAPPLVPTVGRINDDSYLFYRGRVNGIAGTPSSGKSWTAFVVAAQELAVGHTVVFVDLEDNKYGAVSRLRRLGVGDDLLAGPRQAFYYFNPSDPYSVEDRAELEELVARIGPSLLVIDSAGPAMSLAGKDQNADDDVSRWFQFMPSSLASLGPAVVLVDHTAKASERGLWPIGSQRKLAAITGAQYMQDQKPQEAFDQHTAGRSTIICAKDRHGNHRRGSVVAALVHDPTDGFSLESVSPSAPSSPAHQQRELMERVSQTLKDAQGPMSTNELCENVTGKKANVTAAAKALVEDAYLRVTDGPRGAKLYSFVKPFRAVEDKGDRLPGRGEPVEAT